MIFRPTDIPGALLIDPEPSEDERGFFARVWCAREFREHGLNDRMVQSSISSNRKAGTLRGLHFQAAPHAEAKTVRCTRGSVYDVIVDLRRDSPTFTRHFATVLSRDNRRIVYVPEGVAHGFQTLEDDTEVVYQMSEYYAPECAGGVRWDDPAFKISWPDVETRIVSTRDRAFPDFVV